MTIHEQAAALDGLKIICGLVMRIFVVSATVILMSGAASAETDPDSGLIVDEHWQLVKTHCSACHSPKLVTQNRGNRQNWLEMIRWMQETQGLWQFDAATETAILDYLENNYAPQAASRRARIIRSLMPVNPYASETG